MKLTITFQVKKHHIEWAAYELLSTCRKLTKTIVKQYLRDQIEMFGIDDVSLMGESSSSVFLEDDVAETADPGFVETLREARQWVAENYKFEEGP